jgi:hypothetical protein
MDQHPEIHPMKTAIKLAFITLAALTSCKKPMAPGAAEPPAKEASKAPAITPAPA